MNIEQEVEEFRKHTRRLEVEGNLVKVVSLEGFCFEIEVSSQGFRVLTSSVLLEKNDFDDLGQILTSYSPEYRNSFSAELFRKLSEIS